MDCLNLNMKSLRYSETSENARPTSQSHIPGDRNIQQHKCVSLIYCIFRAVFC